MHPQLLLQCLLQLSLLVRKEPECRNSLNAHLHNDTLGILLNNQE